jgi:hypothetical protein
MEVQTDWKGGGVVNYWWILTVQWVNPQGGDEIRSGSGVIEASGIDEYDLFETIWNRFCRRYGVPEYAATTFFSLRPNLRIP